MTIQSAAGYEGTEPFPDIGGPPRTVAGAVRVAVTLAIVIVPFAGLGGMTHPGRALCPGHGG